MTKRFDAADMAEVAHHAITKLMAEGLVPADVDQHITVSRHGKHLVPLGVELTIRFVPG